LVTPFLVVELKEIAQPGHGLPHVLIAGHILPGHPNCQTNSVRILDSIAGCEVKEQWGEALIGVVERQVFGFLLGFLQSIAQIFDHFKSGIWVPSSISGKAFLLIRRMLTFPMGWAEPGYKAPSNAAASQQKRFPGMSIFSVHSFPSGVGLTQLAVPSLTMWEVFGRVAFLKNEVAFAVVGFGQFLKHALAHRS
jgi:hypothetical protein